jgi:hypothetical protein
LRASSERKFQRWFFETRTEQEAKQERIAELEAALKAEQQARAEEAGGLRADPDRAFAERAAAEKASAEEIKRSAEQMVREMRRELQISRDEARRGWEEIGRMEQDERDRTASLRNGEPTLVGGVQVVPMVPGGTGGMVRPPTRDGPLPRENNTNALRAAQEADRSRDTSYTLYDPARSETGTDPFTEDGRETTTSASRQPTYPATSYQHTSNASSAAARAPAGHTASPARGATTTTAPSTDGTYLSYGPDGALQRTPTSTSFYQHQGTSAALHGEESSRPGADSRSTQSHDGTVSEEEYAYDEHGEIRRDAHGHPIIYARGVLSEGSDEYDVQEQLARERMYGQQYGGVSGVEYGGGSTASAGSGNGQGAGYGGWDPMPRHHHPTRLSDVLEEDERSRTSPSRASERSRGVR